MSNPTIRICTKCNGSFPATLEYFYAHSNKAGLRPDCRKCTLRGMKTTRQQTIKGIWRDMIRRCYDVRRKEYSRYGGRGIYVCQRWRESFSAFVQDMGERPEGQSIERVNNDLGYSADNCRWATPMEQANNMRANRLIEFQGETRTLAEWGRHLGVSADRIKQRLNKLGWSIEKALTMPPDNRGSYPRTEKRGDKGIQG